MGHCALRQQRQEHSVGTWGTGIYANDAAADLKSTFGSIVRLPIDTAGILELLAEAAPSLLDPEDEDHTSCWFVVADRLHRYGIEDEPTITRVRQYITSGKDLEMMARLGMSPADLRSRAKVLDSFLLKLSTPRAQPSKRRVLKKPQPFVLGVGDLVTFPVKDGDAANAYCASWEEEWFEPNGYGAALVLNLGHSYEYLAWYSITILDTTWPTAPSADDCLSAHLAWPEYGTLSASHFRKMHMAVIATLKLGEGIDRLVDTRPKPSYEMTITPEYVTTNDISLTNVLAIPSVSKTRPGSSARTAVLLKDVIEEHRR
jgi:hypothetical protein